MLEPRLPGRMSLTNTVPAAVPSLFQSSLPLMPSLAEKNSVPFTLVRNAGIESPAPAMMSFTNTVPAAVPSLFQSSKPLPPPSLAEKNSVPFTLAGALAELALTPCRLPGPMSFTNTVLNVVDSVNSGGAELSAINPCDVEELFKLSEVPMSGAVAADSIAVASRTGTVDTGAALRRRRGSRASKKK